MSWAYEHAEGRDGAFRNLLQTVHALVEEHAGRAASGLARPGEAGSGLSSGDIADILYLMIMEYGRLRENLRKELGSCHEAETADKGMSIDSRELTAWHLAARRAEARLTCAPVPVCLGDFYEDWMNLGPSA